MREGRGTVWIVEEYEVEEGGMNGLAFLGTFQAHHDDGGRVDELPGASADEAIAWGRQRASEVWIRLFDRNWYYAAGTSHPQDAPRWPPADLPDLGRRRRFKGEEWRDRTEFDAPIAWLVEVRVHPPFGTAPEEADAVVAAAAARAGALRWYRGEQEGDLTDKAVLPGEPHPPKVTSMAIAYAVEVEVTRATAKQAMREARNLCDFPARWPPYCVTRPAHAVDGSKTVAT
jgi:hypothetical protein